MDRHKGRYPLSGILTQGPGHHPSENTTQDGFGPSGFHAYPSILAIDGYSTEDGVLSQQREVGSSRATKSA